MDVSVIIVNYNTQKLTQQCVDSIFAKTSGLDFEVILIDNGSTDCSRECFSADERITYIYSEENLGFGKANNLGATYAKGNYLFFLNSDTYLVNNAIFLLWDAMDHLKSETDRVACAGCLLKDADGQIIHSYAHFPSMFHSLMSSTVYPILCKLHLLSHMPTTSNYDYQKYESPLFEVDYVTGADLMVRKEVADQLGLFDPVFFMYYEETEMQHRYMKSGYVSIICQEPCIVHLEGKSNRKSSPGRATQAMQSELRYFKKTSNNLLYQLFSFSLKFGHIITYLIAFMFIQGDTKQKKEHIRSVIRM